MMTITAPPRLATSDAPQTIDMIGLLRSGLHWLHETPQPPCAIIDAHGAVATIGNRHIRFVPLGWAWQAGIVVDVAHAPHVAAPDGAPLNPMHPNETHVLAAQLRDDLDAEITEIRCGEAGLTATIAVERAAHPTLCAAVRRFMAGCPIHHSRRCGRPPHHGGRNCPWYSASQRGVTWPSTAWFAEHETVIGS
jgi:hypothetical protein